MSFTTELVRTVQSRLADLGYSGLFRRMTVPEIYEQMASRSGDARDWVDAHIEEIRSYR